MLSAFISFPGSSAGKEFTCSAGDPISIPRSGRSAGEGIGYPLQYSWASLGAQLIKTLPSMWETWVQSQGWEDPLEKGAATHFSILVWRSLWIEGRASRLQSMGSQGVWHDWATFTCIYKVQIDIIQNSNFWLYTKSQICRTGLAVKLQTEL